MLTANALWLLAAVLVQGALALGLMWYLGSIRIPMIVKGQVSMGKIALSREAWPEREKPVSNAFDNQFQLPVLLYVAIFAALYFGPTWFEVLLAWAFVVSRYVHAAIHITSNDVVHRFAVFLIGPTILCAFWLDLAIRLILIALGGPT